MNFEQDEIDALVAAGKLKADEGFLFNGVRSTQLSVARFYGGAKVNGKHYVYFPETDTLVREDVVKAIHALRRKRKKALEPEQPSFPLADHKPPEIDEVNGSVRVTIFNPDAQ